MTKLPYALLLLMGGCAASASDAPSQNQPPSVALVPPSFYYHYRYDPRTHRKVREVIRAPDLVTPTPEEVEAQRRLDAASESLYRMRKGAAR